MKMYKSNYIISTHLFNYKNDPCIKYHTIKNQSCDTKQFPCELKYISLPKGSYIMASLNTIQTLDNC